MAEQTVRVLFIRCSAKPLKLIKVLFHCCRWGVFM